jgi:hypothetical protein
MGLKYINIFTSKDLQNFPKLIFGPKRNHLATLIRATYVKRRWKEMREKYST